MVTRLVVGVTGGSGAPLAVRLLERLRELEVETDLVVSRWGRATLAHETQMEYRELAALATRAHGESDMTSPIASGSVVTDGMIVVPCSVRSLGAIANGVGDNLVGRAADVTLKERRPLVLVVRETPLSAIHLTNMLAVTNAGATVLPPVPAFYARPENVDEIVDHLAIRMLDAVGIHVESMTRWHG